MGEYLVALEGTWTYTGSDRTTICTQPFYHRAIEQLIKGSTNVC